MSLADLFLYGTIGFLSTHELDAMQRHEWRVLPLTSWMPEDFGRDVFLWMHIPLFGLIAWIAVQGSGHVSATFLAAFAIVHVGLHWLFRNHPQYEFQGLQSRILISGAGVFGAGFLLVGPLSRYFS